MTALLDSNVLVALLVSDHVHHDAAEAWLSGWAEPIATSPITQGSLVRLLLRSGDPASAGSAMISALAADSRHEFWPDDVTYGDVRMTGVIGHRQVTDAYLAQLARRHGGKLATFDKGLAALHSDVAELVPS